MLMNSTVIETLYALPGGAESMEIDQPHMSNHSQEPEDNFQPTNGAVTEKLEGMVGGDDSAMESAAELQNGRLRAEKARVRALLHALVTY